MDNTRDFLLHTIHISADYHSKNDWNFVTSPRRMHYFCRLWLEWQTWYLEKVLYVTPSCPINILRHCFLILWVLEFVIHQGGRRPSTEFEWTRGYKEKEWVREKGEDGEGKWWYEEKKNDWKREQTETVFFFNARKGRWVKNKSTEKTA